jgi:hypothetical protein
MTTTHEPENPMTATEPRGYSLGLPVTIEVRADGSVHAYVDLSEAGRRRDLRESQDGLDDDDVIPDEQIDADADTIDAAVTAGTVTLHDAWAQPQVTE